MSASAAAAVSAGVAVQSAAVSVKAVAHAAAVRSCKVSMQGYQHEPASDAQMRDYVACVGIVYPPAPSTDQTLLLKGCVVVMIASVFVGAAISWKCRLSYEGQISAAILGAVAGPVSAAVAILAIAGIWMGLKFIVS